jgi:hypothetical protein
VRGDSFNRLQRCYECHEDVIDAFFDLADAIITVRRLIREASTLYRWDDRPARRPLVWISAVLTYRTDPGGMAEG